MSGVNNIFEQRRMTPNSLRNLSRSAPIVRSELSVPRTAYNAGERSRSRTRTGTRTRTQTGTQSRTRTRTHTSDGHDSYIVALIDNVAKDVGLSAYNLNSFEIEMRQFADSNNFTTIVTVLLVIDPVEILLSVSSAGTPIDQAIQGCPQLENVKRTYIGRNYFNETNGELAVKKFAIEPCPNLTNLGASACYLALASCGALIRYVEHVDQVTFIPSTLRIRLQPNDHTMFLDIATLDGLEVVRNARTAVSLQSETSKACLLNVIDYTVTRVGRRLLRRGLLEPCILLDTIERRQKTVHELSNSEVLYNAVIFGLKNFPDLERALAAMMTKETSRLRNTIVRNQATKSDFDSVEDTIEQNIDTTTISQEDDMLDKQELGNSRGDFETDFDKVDKSQHQGKANVPPSDAIIQNILSVKTSLDAIPKLLQALRNVSSPLLCAIARSLRSQQFESISQKISMIIEEEATVPKGVEEACMQAAFAVKKGRNGRLDTCRKLLMENREDMDTVCRMARETHGLQKVRLGYHSKRGYHLVVPRRELDGKPIPEEFILVDKGQIFYRFSITELERLNLLFHETQSEIWYLTSAELGCLIREILLTDNLMSLYTLCDNTALLDCLTSFVTYSSLSPVSMVCPRFAEGGPIILKQAHHPVLLSINRETSIPNSVFLGQSSPLHIITGRNQAGKSTFIRMVGTMVILAHTGCFLPAEVATIPRVQRITTHLCINDDVLQNTSHFSREMRDVANILSAVHPESVTSGRRSKKTTKVRTTGDSQEDDSATTLVLIDELGRATSTVEGFSIAWAVIEELARALDVLTLFTTHFHGLCALARTNPIIQTFHLEVVAYENDNINTATLGPNRDAESRTRKDATEAAIKFTYKVRDGDLNDTTYGIEVAQAAGFPDSVLQEAKKHHDQLAVHAIHTADAVIKNLIKMTAEENAYLRGLRKAVRIHRRLSAIKWSGLPSEQQQRLMNELCSKGVPRSAPGENEKVVTAPASKTDHLNNDQQDQDEIGRTRL